MVLFNFLISLFFLCPVKEEISEMNFKLYCITTKENLGVHFLISYHFFHGVGFLCCFALRAVPEYRINLGKEEIPDFRN